MQRDEHSELRIGGNVSMHGSAMAGRDAQVVHVDHGAALSIASDPTEIRRALLDLAAQIRTGAASVPNPDEVADTAERAASEVGREHPNRTILSGLMHAVGGAVGAAGTLARTVTAIQAAIDGLFA
ncbi:hypothetical protein VMT65_14170 [Nocardia sp. CDC153]|uniref:hypothetical protein n=1 Tax=Nocardia sp. CDC153 TaxID=3112167 RepID=UPI002DBF5CBE|nr:hypothetical protein [Nocardia sp. CDC153]MEC3954181.1 hypothetical protein [Nocardia sp. CDC153]